MSGYVAMQRAWQDHDIFAGDEYSRRDAWAWLIAQAAWKPTKTRIKGTQVQLQRGQLCFSQRFLADKWGWSKSRTDRFIALLREEGMIETCSKNGATAGHAAGQGQAIITICNYDKFQAPLREQRGNDELENGATAGQQRGKEEEGNKGTIEPEGQGKPSGDGLAFSGRIIRLTFRDFSAWKKAYPSIDLMASLQSRDDWLATEADEKTRKRWFMSTSNYLANLQQKAAAVERAPVWDGMP